MVASTLASNFVPCAHWGPTLLLGDLKAVVLALLQAQIDVGLRARFRFDFFCVALPLVLKYVGCSETLR